MPKINFNLIVPHFVALIVFILSLFIYFPELLDKKSIRMDDIEQHKGMSNELADYRERTGEEAVWTNTMFGGMPGYLISTVYKGNLLRHSVSVMKLGLPRPADTMFVLMTGMYVLLLVLAVRQPLAALGAIAYAFTTYNLLIIEAGHTSKIEAISFMPWVLMSIILAFKGRWLWGSLLTALFLSLEIKAGHIQITYYLSFILLFTGLAYLADAIRKKQLPQFAKTSAALMIAAVLAVLSNISSLYTYYDYGKDSIRGKSELTIKDKPESDGLDKDYALEYSYGVGEVFSYMIPNVYGGASNLSLGDHKDAMKEVQEQYRSVIPMLPQYWAETSTTGPFYAGAVICFLCVLAFFIVEGPIRWAFLASMILAILLSWGKNFESFSVFMLDNFPGYNKFRAVKMTLVITDFLIPLMAILGLNEVLKRPEVITQKKVAFWASVALTAGLCLVFWMMPDTFFSFDFLDDRVKDQLIDMLAQSNIKGAQATQWLSGMMADLEQARIEIFKADAMRAILLIAAGAALVFAYVRFKFNPLVLTVAMFILVVGDLFSVDKRYVNKKDFVSNSKSLVPFEPSVADEAIFTMETGENAEVLNKLNEYQTAALNRKNRVKSGNRSADESKYRFLGLMANTNFRVLNLSKSTFNDAATSFFHKSVGGYSAVKLERYQEMIEFHIQDNMSMVRSMFSGSLNDSVFQQGMREAYALNMLNTKYIIYNPEAPPLVNSNALGNAWFVREVKQVNNANEEIKAMNKDFSPQNTAIVDKRFASQLQGIGKMYNEEYNIRLEQYAPNYLKYKVSAPDKGVAIFSEIYYEKGWNAYIDGKPAPHFRANYILRGMVVPKGDYTVEFKFEPSIYYATERVSYAASSLIILLIAGMGFTEFKRRKNKLS